MTVANKRCLSHNQREGRKEREEEGERGRKEREEEGRKRGRAGPAQHFHTLPSQIFHTFKRLLKAARSSWRKSFTQMASRPNMPADRKREVGPSMPIWAKEHKLNHSTSPQVTPPFQKPFLTGVLPNEWRVLHLEVKTQGLRPEGTNWVYENNI